MYVSVWVGFSVFACLKVLVFAPFCVRVYVSVCVCVRFCECECAFP